MPKNKPHRFSRLLMASTIVALGTCSTVAMAGGIERSPTHSGFYISAGINGVGYQAADSNTSETFNGTNFNSTIEFLEKNSMSFGWTGAVGWQFNQLFRVDLAYVYANLPLTGSLVNTAGTGLVVSGLNSAMVRAVGVSDMGFVDAYLDVMSMFSDRSAFFHPYIGGGVGFSYNELINFRQTNYATPTTWSVSNGNQTNFAWRILVGLNFPFTEHLIAYTQYSYVYGGKYIMGNSISGVSVTGSGDVPTPAQFSISSNMLGAGLTYLF